MSDKFLWVLPKWPLPEIDGSRKAACALISSLTRAGAIIDICALAGEDESLDMQDARSLLGVRDVFVVRRQSTRLIGARSVLGALMSLILQPKVPVTFRYYFSKKVREGLAQIIEKGRSRWDFIVYEGLHPASHCQTLDGVYQAFLDLKPIYRAQNIECDLWYQKAKKSNFAFRYFFNHQARVVERFENGLVQKAALTACVSDNDKEGFKKKNPHAKCVTIPVGYKFHAQIICDSKDKDLNLLFLGRLDWAPNKDGLKWFLEEVWPIAASKNRSLKLTVAGSGDGVWLESYAGLNKTAFLGCVGDTFELYSRASLCLVPIFYGSGTRVKAIEAATFGRPCLSTALGVSGLGLRAGKEYFRAETCQEWVSQLESLTRQNLQEVGKSAFLRLKERFDADNCAKVFLQKVSCIKSAARQPRAA